ncbi:hypothetical protein [Thauera humireducens]|uniref:hypothetical protein n=1 Tax=Thauera humireducens TaxID=1134435 RepID=UPI00311DE460
MSPDVQQSLQTPQRGHPVLGHQAANRAGKRLPGLPHPCRRSRTRRRGLLQPSHLVPGRGRASRLRHRNRRVAAECACRARHLHSMLARNPVRLIRRPLRRNPHPHRPHRGDGGAGSGHPRARERAATAPMSLQDYLDRRNRGGA